MEKPAASEFPSLELPQDRVLRLGAERLRQSVRDLPLRYAPFYRRLSELWQLPEPYVVSELTRARQPAAWRRTLLPGLKQFLLPLPPGGSLRARLLCFEPGATLPEHRHHGAEQVLVLEGSYTDDAGQLVGPGGAQAMPAGSQHRLHISADERCVTAVTHDFQSFMLFGIDAAPL